MKFNILFVVLLSSLLISSCDGPVEIPKSPFEENSSSDASKLSEHKSTVFLPTLESNFNVKNNGIYAASFLMAWDEIKKEIGLPLTDFTSGQLELMNKVSSHKGVLNPEEYTTAIEVDDLIIRAKALFKMVLPFEVPFSTDVISHEFGTQPVASFGFYGTHSAANILYYHDNADFAIKLQPKNKKHEIILIKTHFGDSINFKEETERLNRKVKSFVDAKNHDNRWKYALNDRDFASIPSVNFNIETNYKSIEGSTFKTEVTDYKVLEAYQRTAFLLDESGAIVESEAEVAVEEALEEEEVRIQPKRMVFNKSYLILLKRKDSKYSYFAMFLANSELMEQR
ncbi:MAG: hypothetical protein ACJA0Q_001276 [Saprospiraceae bacterium]|jgi:hypothetical protein